MKKLILHSAFIVFALVCSNGVIAQKYTKKAFKAVQTGKNQLAKTYIDSAVNNPGESESAQTWRFKGFIYKKLEDIHNPNLEIREEALKGFLRSNALDNDEKYKKKNDKAINGLIQRYYNQSVINLQSRKFEQSTTMYNTFKSRYKKYIDATKDFNKKDIVYYNAYASYYGDNMDLKNYASVTPRLDTLINIYKKVLKLDPNNYNANYNTAIIYYNIGVELVYALDPKLDVAKLKEAARKCVYYFKKALPYMDKAYKLRPDRKETVEALYGIHLNLSNEEKALHFKELKNKK